MSKYSPHHQARLHDALVLKCMPRVCLQLQLMSISLVVHALQIKGYPTLKVIHKAEEYKAFRGSRDLSSLKSFVEEAAKELTAESS